MIKRKEPCIAVVLHQDPLGFLLSPYIIVMPASSAMPLLSSCLLLFRLQCVEPMPHIFIFDSIHNWGGSEWMD